MDDGRLLTPAVLLAKIPSHGVGDRDDVGIGREQSALERYHERVKEPDLPIGSALAFERVEPRAVADVRGHDVGAERREALSMDDVETAARDEGRRQEKREDGCERARAPRDDAMRDDAFRR